MVSFISASCIIITICCKIDPFRIGPLSSNGMANLIGNKELNREAIALYNVVVRASDMGDPARSSTMVNVYYYYC